MDSEKIVESVKFLLKSVRQLSDHFLESERSSKQRLDTMKRQLDTLALKLAAIEDDIHGLHNASESESGSSRAATGKIEMGTKDRLINTVNLALETIVEAYRNTPSLLEPFARTCSISGRTVSGLISETEIELFPQGTTWIIETVDGDWLVFPRPGMIKRPSQRQSLERLFDINGNADFSTEIEVLKAGRATPVEHGKRWYLEEKGLIGDS